MEWMVLSVLCVTLLLISLDNTILNVALPSIVRSLHATSSELQWIVDAYAVVFGGLRTHRSPASPTSSMNPLLAGRQSPVGAGAGDEVSPNR